MENLTIRFTVNVPGKKEHEFAWMLYDRPEAKNLALALDESPFITNVSLTVQEEQEVAYR